MRQTPLLCDERRGPTSPSLVFEDGDKRGAGDAERLGQRAVIVHVRVAGSNEPNVY